MIETITECRAVDSGTWCNVVKQYNNEVVSVRTGLFMEETNSMPCKEKGFYNYNDNGNLYSAKTQKF